LLCADTVIAVELNYHSTAESIPKAISAEMILLMTRLQLLWAKNSDKRCLGHRLGPLSDENSPFMRLCETNSVRTVFGLLEAKAPETCPVTILLTPRPTDGKTPLQVACQAGHAKVASLLLLHGADPNQQSKSGTTPLLTASKNGHDKVVELLLGHHAEVNKSARSGVSALFAASENGHREVVMQLLEKYAEVNKQTLADGTTPLIIASLNGYHEVVGLLLQHGADVNHTDKRNQTPLVAASKSGHLQVVNRLLECSEVVVSPLAVDIACFGAIPPLHLSSQNGQSEIVQSLLSNEADVNQRDFFGRTALYIALQHGYMHVANILLSRSAELGPFSVPEKVSGMDGWYPRILAAINADDADTMERIFNADLPRRLYPASLTERKILRCTDKVQSERWEMREV
jgi:ankyrin repeat protein